MAGRTDSARRLLFLLVIFVLGAGLLVVRLGYWQIAQRDQLVDDARRQIYYQAPVPSKRGQIFDRSGTVVLAASVVRDRLIVSAQHMTAMDRARMVSFLATQLNLDPLAMAAIRARLETAKPYLVIARDLAPEQSEAILAAAQTAGISGISFESDSIRSYPQEGGSPHSTLAANLIGFVNREGAGQYGVEQYYQGILAGQPKLVEADRDSSGKPIMETMRTINPGVPGEDIRLTIDAGLQLAVEQEVMAARLANDAKSVSAVVMDPWTGEIYAEATYPSYDANQYASVATDDNSVFQDPVVSVVYEPGSVFKMFTVLAGLEQGTTTLQTKYRDTGRMKLDNGKAKVTDADGKAMGDMKLEDGIAYSRNIVATKVALGLAPTTDGAAKILHEVWTRFGFGTATGIDVSGEVRGLVTDPADRPWRQIDLANGSFGQGVAVTQIQLAAAYAAMVNGGTLVQPHVVAGIGSQVITTSGKPGVIDPAMSPTLSGLMQHVLASPWYVDKSQVPGFWVGGKTGTAQVWDQARGRWLQNNFNFSCVGFIGRTEGRPDLVVAVRIQEAVPARNAQGQLVLPITSTELFRRVATDSITTAGLLPPLDPSTFVVEIVRADEGVIEVHGGAIDAAGARACATLPSVTVEGPKSPNAGAGPTSADAPALTADDLRRLTGGRLLRTSARPVRGAAVDSRLVMPGQLFVALPGERTDGHQFLADAAVAGAAALVVSRPVPPAVLDALGDVTVVAVPDGLIALAAIAAGWRSRFDPLVVGITGSIAKTSTKEAVATVLGARYRTLRTEGNQNNEIGLPLTLLRLDRDHRAVVLEMGMYAGGEIADLARLARPRIGIVTAVHGVHLSRMGSMAAIERAKGELVEALPSDGVAVLNQDDRRVRRMAERTAARTLGYGFASDADVSAEDVASAGLDGMRFTLRLPPAHGGRATRIPARIPGLGKLSVHNALAAAAVGHAAGMEPAVISHALAGGWSAAHRGQVVRLGRVTVIDDSYNASPASVTAALDLLAGLTGRRIAVLGEMLELGKGAASGHRDVGIAAAATCDLLVVVGSGASGIAAGARGAGLDPSRIIEARDAEAALDLLRTRLRDGDVVLVKASRGVELDLLVEALRTELGTGAR